MCITVLVCIRSIPDRGKSHELEVESKWPFRLIILFPYKCGLVGNSSTELMPEWLLLDLEVPDTAGGLAAWYTAMMALLRPTLEGAGAVAATRAPARRVCLGAVHTVCALGARA